MVKFILSFLLVSISFISIQAQSFRKIILDTVVNADEVYLDRLNHLYLVNNVEKSICKYDLNFNLLKKISFKQGWDHAVMDVSDPFKSILYYPGDYKILVLDESLSVIASFEESELNAESVVCQFSTNYLCIFSNNVLKLKNYAQQKIISSVPLRDNNKTALNIPFQLKQSNEYLYLLRPGIGISRYTNQLFEERAWLNTKITKMDVTGHWLFYLVEGDLIMQDTKTKMEEIVVTSLSPINSFTVNSEYLVVLINDRLTIYKN